MTRSMLPALALFVLAGAPFGVVAPGFSDLHAAAQAPEAAATAEVKRVLSEQRDLRRLTVTVNDGVATLAGPVPSLWHKQDAIRRASSVAGISGVVSEGIELPRVESDLNVAVAVRRAVDNYSYFTIFDYIDALIRNGVVTLTGSVTGERDKAEEIGAEVAKIRGVHEVRNQIALLPPSQGDDRIRAALFSRIASSQHFDHITDRNAPFRLIVHNGDVTIYGTVQTEIELRELEQIVRFTAGVQRVENKLQTIVKPK